MKNWLIKRLKKDERGLTLVELLAVVVILAIVAAIAFVLIGNVMENSRKDAHVANAQQVIAAAKLYDSTVEPVTSVDLKKLKEENLMDSFVDPWKKNSYEDATVTKDPKTGRFSVTLVTDSSTSCEIDGIDEVTLAKGRKEVCGKE